MTVAAQWVPPADRRAELLRAVHAQRGRAMTLREIAAVVDWPDAGPLQLAPLVSHLVAQGVLTPLPGPWWARRYVPARLCRWFEQAA
jgi:hypothetical protein